MLATSATNTNYSPPVTDERVTSAAARDVRVRTLDDGPLTCALEISDALDIPEEANADRHARSGEPDVPLQCAMALRIRRGSSAVECRIRVTNVARDHRLRARRHRRRRASIIIARTAHSTWSRGLWSDNTIRSMRLQRG